MSSLIQYASVDARNATYDIQVIQCGVWSHEGNRVLFNVHYNKSRRGTLLLGKNDATVQFSEGDMQFRIKIGYRSCRNIVLTTEIPSITFTGTAAPQILSFSGQSIPTPAAATGVSPTVREVRLSSIDEKHAKVVGASFGYRIGLRKSEAVQEINLILLRNVKNCPVLSLDLSHTFPSEVEADAILRLDRHITDPKILGDKPFTLKYQVLRLARNGIISPARVISLLPKVAELYDSHGLDATVLALRRLSRGVKAPGPGTEQEEVSTVKLNATLQQFAKEAAQSSRGDPVFKTQGERRVELVHKIVVTPVGIYLEGPEPEPSNRVLRAYSDHCDHFARVVFRDEDGGAVSHAPRADMKQIFSRFRSVLANGISIAGRHFEFLGFSHSSLRSHACWSVAPMNFPNEVIGPNSVLHKLGDVSHIRSPSTCAARIGQSFSITRPTIDLDDEQVGELPTVTRNGRDFSDGVGTISYDLLEKVLKKYNAHRNIVPRTLQIRFQGAKGLVSLDPKLQGQRLMLRSNMVKFMSSFTRNLEVCDAAFEPKPMVLNRQLIKVLEDLRVPRGVFLDLQRNEIDALRSRTATNAGAALLLDRIGNVKATRFSDLIMRLGEIGLQYQQDTFINCVVEMSIMWRLQDIKYRGRLGVDKGVTLFGIMDETGQLQEGEILVITKKDQASEPEVLVQDRVVVTRSPVMHPGDVQVVRAVDVPASSGLRLLSNVVVFSQFGVRDLPSQLSGGDLDGDMYNVIWDTRLIPDNAYPPADYPRIQAIELDRTVVREDMSDFFVRFMEMDSLGVISSRHMQLADQRDQGVLDPDCIAVASLASTAVDFSKTGIPVDMGQLPKGDLRRPDFMAPTPRVLISNTGQLDLEDENVALERAFGGMSIKQRITRFYESHKVLGYLYRAIDERQFLYTKFQENSSRVQSMKNNEDVMIQLVKYLQQVFVNLGIKINDAFEADALQIRASYEESLANILYAFTPAREIPLSEQEAFSGIILGRADGLQGASLHTLTTAMREQLEAIVEHAMTRIIKGDQGDTITEAPNNKRDSVGAMQCAFTCLALALSPKFEGNSDRRLGKLQSFRYIAANVCLSELHVHFMTSGNRSGLPSLEEIDTKMDLS